MGDWLRNSSKGERIGVVLTVLFGIFVFATLMDNIDSVAAEGLAYLMFFFGFPVVMGWGIYWIVRAPKRP